MKHTCEVCKKEFSQKCHLDKHKQRKTPCVAPSAAPAAPVPATPKPSPPQAPQPPKNEFVPVSLPPIEETDNDILEDLKICLDAQVDMLFDRFQTQTLEMMRLLRTFRHLYNTYNRHIGFADEGETTSTTSSESAKP